MYIRLILDLFSTVVNFGNHILLQYIYIYIYIQIQFVFKYYMNEHTNKNIFNA